MRIAQTIFFLFFLLPAATKRDIPVIGYRLVWHDEFEGNLLDKTKWALRSPGKRGDAYNCESAAQLDGKGHLLLSITKKNDSVFTGMIATENLFETRYGYFECKAKLLRLKGSWVAFWLQSSANQDNGTPEKNGAEIDIFEYFPNLDTNSVTHMLHWGGYGATHKSSGPVRVFLKKTVDDYHTFGLEWTPEGYSTFVDGVQTYKGHSLISKVPEFMILSMEADSKVAGPLQLTGDPQYFTVDYVRVYKKKI
ncbi:glycoside hydrolase family 16 protein [Flavitalea flava]